MILRRLIWFLLLTMLALSLVWGSTAAADKIKERDTIASLERKTVEVRPGEIIV